MDGYWGKLRHLLHIETDGSLSDSSNLFKHILNILKPPTGKLKDPVTKNKNYCFVLESVDVNSSVNHLT